MYQGRIYLLPKDRGVEIEFGSRKNKGAEGRY
jgi:hypothetical protein